MVLLTCPNLFVIAVSGPVALSTISKGSLIPAIYFCRLPFISRFAISQQTSFSLSDIAATVSGKVPKLANI
jgi:hypothetical protein